MKIIHISLQKMDLDNVKSAIMHVLGPFIGSIRNIGSRKLRSSNDNQREAMKQKEKWAETFVNIQEGLMRNDPQFMQGLKIGYLAGIERAKMEGVEVVCTCCDSQESIRTLGDEELPTEYQLSIRDKNGHIIPVQPTGSGVERLKK